AREIAIGAVAADDDHRTPERSLHGRKYVEAVDEDASIHEIRLGGSVCMSIGEGTIGTHRSHYGQALTSGELMAIADEFEGRCGRIAATQKPTELNRSLANGWQCCRRKELRVFWVRAAMSASI